MNYNRLETSLIDVIKEEQAKLGSERDDPALLSAQFPESFLWQ